MTPDISAIGAGLVALVLLVGAALADRPKVPHGADPTLTPESLKADLIRLMVISRRAGVDFEAVLSSAQAEDYRNQGSTNV